ncbi:MAG TPA: DUF2799 domain-containing protein [Cellvibrio sp.]|nr:DUF2799 domain-containing protein [Cellvibrio sp.]
MNKHKLGCLGVAIILSLSGCAGTEVKPKEVLRNCASVNWFDRGHADAMAGEEFTKIDEYTADCKLENVVPKDKVYFSGYLKGIEAYCTYDRGYDLGRQAAKSDRGCAKTVAYVDGFTKGQAEFKESTERAKIERLTRPRGSTSVGTNVATPQGL